jgi:hypothetical protein
MQAVDRGWGCWKHRVAVSDAAANVDASIDGSAPPQDGYAWERLEDQLGWYDRKSGGQKRWFQRLKVVQIVMAAAIPVAAGNGADAWITGTLGAAIVVVEGFQQLFQFQQNWVSYRATAEALKHEKYLYLSRVGGYANAARPDALLAERVEQLVSQEQSNWSLAQADTRAGSKA